LSFDWDYEAGERWARFLSSNRAVAILRTVVPSAFLKPKQPYLKRFLERLGVEVIELADFDAPVVKLELEQIAGLVDREKWSDTVRAGQMSAGDLWWATI